MKEVSICEKWFSPVPQRCLCINEPKICPEYIDRIEVETLKEYILSRKHHLLISGIGGMGKTTLAEKLFNEVKMMFDVSLWMTYKGSVVAGIAMTMAEKSVDEDLIMHFEKRMNSKDNQRNVIFIDDVDDNYLSDKNRDILERNAIVIVTSRMESISGYITHEVLPLNDIDCIKLFKEYYKRTISSDDEEMIIELVNRFGKSTLLIELFARAANKSTKELNEYLGCILEKGISSTGIKVQNNKEKTYASVSDYYEITSEYQIDCLVTISNWNRVTQDAYELGRRNGIGVFTMSEFMGALNCAKPSVYIRPIDREDNDRAGVGFGRIG